MMLGGDQYVFPEDNQYAHVHTYNVTYKCAHCGHEWHDLVQTKK